VFLSGSFVTIVDQGIGGNNSNILSIRILSSSGVQVAPEVPFLGEVALARGDLSEVVVDG
jgi:hypothetical protein